MSDQSRGDGPSPAPEGEISSDSATTAGSRSRSHFFIWVAVLAVVLVALLHESLFGGKGLSPASGVLDFPPWHETNGPFNWLLADQYNVFVTQKEFVHQQFWQGHFPLWNPYLDCGLPNLASVQGALLFPINLLVLMPLGPFYGGGLAAFLETVSRRVVYDVVPACAGGVQSGGVFVGAGLQFEQLHDRLAGTSACELGDLPAAVVVFDRAGLSGSAKRRAGDARRRPGCGCGSGSPWFSAACCWEGIRRRWST